MTDRLALIEERLRAALQPENLQIVDDGAAHAGHAGGRGGGYFSVLIVSPLFAGQSLLQRHRLVYQALGDLMNRDIHALSIKALTPDER